MSNGQTKHAASDPIDNIIHTAQAAVRVDLSNLCHREQRYLRLMGHELYAETESWPRSQHPFLPMAPLGFAIYRENLHLVR